MLSGSTSTSILESNKYDIEKEPLLLTAQSKYNIATKNWRRALDDSNKVIMIMSDSPPSQAFCSKIEALFNLNNFEQVECNT